MYELHFTGIEADKLLNTVSVVGNNKADIINFLVEKVQHSISLAGYNAYIKVQNKSGSYVNKEKLNVVELEDILSLSWTLTWDYTQYKELQCQLQFQSDNGEDVVWQSRIFYLRLQSTLGVDGVISSKYPTILTQLENEVGTYDGRISALEEKTPITKIYNSIPLTKDATLQFYRAFDEETDRPANSLSIVGVKASSIICKCIAERNGVQLSARTLSSYFTDNFSSLFSEITDTSLVYSAYAEDNGNIVYQAIRVGSAKNVGLLTLTVNEDISSMIVRVGKYDNFYDGEHHYDENATVVINEVEYDLPESGYIDIDVDISSEHQLSISNKDGRIYVYRFVVQGADDEYYEVKLETEESINEHFNVIGHELIIK